MLTWLAQQVSALWIKVKQLVKDAWNWAYIQGSRAYHNAVKWVIANIKPIAAAANQRALAALDKIKYLKSNILAAAKTLVQELEAKVMQRVLLLQDFFKNPMYFLRSWLPEWIWTMEARFDQKMLLLSDFFRDPWSILVHYLPDWLLTLEARVMQRLLLLEDLLKHPKDILTILFPGTFDRLFSILETWWGTLAAFLGDPLGFILSFFIAYILPVLEYSLAYAIDPHNPDLPPWPVWGQGGYGGAIYPGKGPPPGASGLAPPLDYLRISGYIFRSGHPGIDLGLTIGTPVYAMHSGKIIYAAWDSRNYGYTVVIRGGEWWTRYGHLSKLGVTPGQSVTQSQTIGLGGSTGNSTGPHLHLEIKHNGSYIDPVTVLNV